MVIRCCTETHTSGALQMKHVCSSNAQYCTVLLIAGDV
uniref:Uncharacterized protein n=1 Tax=Anguilla anguilla TaxID=7936 RepID=A0A0E9QW79_ANGAN